jgi:hypothetical protein
MLSDFEDYQQIRSTKHPRTDILVVDRWLSVAGKPLSPGDWVGIFDESWIMRAIWEMSDEIGIGERSPPTGDAGSRKMRIKVTAEPSPFARGGRLSLHVQLMVVTILQFRSINNRRNRQPEV